MESAEVVDEALGGGEFGSGLELVVVSLTLHQAIGTRLALVVAARDTRESAGLLGEATKDGSLLPNDVAQLVLLLLLPELLHILVIVAAGDAHADGGGVGVAVAVGGARAGLDVRVDVVVAAYLLERAFDVVDGVAADLGGPKERQDPTAPIVRHSLHLHHFDVGVIAVAPGGDDHAKRRGHQIAVSLRHNREAMGNGRELFASIGAGSYFVNISAASVV